MMVSADMKTFNLPIYVSAPTMCVSASVCSQQQQLNLAMCTKGEGLRLGPVLQTPRAGKCRRGLSDR